MTAKVTIAAVSCSLYVEGMDFQCPLCKTFVKSGERHNCKRRADGSLTAVTQPRLAKNR